MCLIFLFNCVCFRVTVGGMFLSWKIALDWSDCFQISRMAKASYDPKFWKCPNSNCEFVANLPPDADHRAAQVCSKQLFAHLKSEESTCLAEAGYTSFAQYQKVSQIIQFKRLHFCQLSGENIEV